MIEYLLQRHTANFGGGMGAVAPMERSAAAVEMLAYRGVIRVVSLPQAKASAACHDKQIGLCVHVGHVAVAGGAA